MKTYLLIAPALLLAACTAQSPNEQAAVDRSGEGSQATTKPSTAHPPASSRIGTAIGTTEWSHKCDAVTTELTS